MSLEFTPAFELVRTRCKVEQWLNKSELVALQAEAR
jgi:hypothetical protein